MSTELVVPSQGVLLTLQLLVAGTDGRKHGNADQEFWEVDESIIVFIE